MVQSLEQLASEYAYIKSLEGKTKIHEILDTVKTPEGLFFNIAMPIEEEAWIKIPLDDPPTPEHAFVYNLFETGRIDEDTENAFKHYPLPLTFEENLTHATLRADEIEITAEIHLDFNKEAVSSSIDWRELYETTKRAHWYNQHTPIDSYANAINAEIGDVSLLDNRSFQVEIRTHPGDKLEFPLPKQTSMDPSEDVTARFIEDLTGNINTLTRETVTIAPVSELPTEIAESYPVTDTTDTFALFSPQQYDSYVLPADHAPTTPNANALEKRLSKPLYHTAQVAFVTVFFVAPIVYYSVRSLYPTIEISSLLFSGIGALLLWSYMKFEQQLERKNNNTPF